MAWQVSIEKVENGFICSYESDIDDNLKVEEKFVFEESYDDEDKEKYKTMDSEKIAISRMFEWLTEHFGIQYDKYGEDNMQITWKRKGHKL